MPRKIASVKKAKPSNENGIPITAPACCINCGHRRPSSKDRTVPEIAPTAKRMVVPFAQRFASKRYARSPVDLHRHSEMVIIKGNETPMAAKMMWNAKDMPIWDRAAMKLSMSLLLFGIGYEMSIRTCFEDHVSPLPWLVIDQTPLVACAGVIDCEQDIPWMNGECLAAYGCEFEYTSQRKDVLRGR